MQLGEILRRQIGSVIYTEVQWTKYFYLFISSIKVLYKLCIKLLYFAQHNIMCFIRKSTKTVSSQKIPHSVITSLYFFTLFFSLIIFIAAYACELIILPQYWKAIYILPR